MLPWKIASATECPAWFSVGHFAAAIVASALDTVRCGDSNLAFAAHHSPYRLRRKRSTTFATGIDDASVTVVDGLKAPVEAFDGCPQAHVGKHSGC